MRRFIKIKICNNNNNENNINKVITLQGIYETFTLRKSKVINWLAFANVHSFCRVMASDTEDV